MSKILRTASTVFVSSLVLIGTVACAPASTSTPSVAPSSSASPSASASASPSASAISNVTDTAAQLRFLIEEEKLAYDSYTAMYAKWGARVFGNILKSEANHQSQVLLLLNARGIADPRSNSVGVFKNADLQALYDQLMVKGVKSAQDAYEVGIAIEERDIADITDMLATADDADVIATLERLRQGSENHLRAFNNQI